MLKKDLSGMRFTRLLVVEEHPQRKHGNVRWVCKCDCGKIVIVNGTLLTREETKSCGCLKAENIGNRRRTHGLTKTPTYNSWRGMIERCHNEKNISYKFYGGKGISVSREWLDFNIFLKDMGERPQGYQLDRIDSGKDYAKGNCRWVDLATQSRNRHSVKLSTDKVSEIKKLKASGATMADISRRYGVSKGTIHKVLRGDIWQ